MISRTQYSPFCAFRSGAGTCSLQHDARAAAPLPDRRRAAGIWREIFNSDSTFYGGSNLGNASAVNADPVPAHGQAQSLALILPPLATIFLKPY